MTGWNGIPWIILLDPQKISLAPGVGVVVEGLGSWQASLIVSGAGVCLGASNDWVV